MQEPWVAVNDEAIALLNAGHPHEAALSFRHAIRLTSSRDGYRLAAIFFNLGIAMKDLGRHHDSIIAYLTAIRLRPVFPQAHFNLGRSFQILADDPGPGGYLRLAVARKQVLLRAAHHFRRSLGSASAADSYRSLEEVLHQLGDEAAARRAHVELLRWSRHDGLRLRRRVPCEIMRDFLEHEMLGGDSATSPPLSLCSAIRHESLRDAQNTFSAQGYASLPKLLADDVHDFAVSYYRRQARHSSTFYRDEPSPRDREHDSILAKDRWALDNDPFGLFLAGQLSPVVQQITGMQARPAFVKAAWYTGGSKLPPHRDQVQNTWSISLVLAISNVSLLSAWPLHLIAAPTERSTKQDIKLVSPTVLFAGRDFWHFRSCCLSPGDHALVLLLHFVPADFPTVACALRLDAVNSRPDGLLHECQAVNSTTADTDRSRSMNSLCGRPDNWLGSRHEVDPHDEGTHLSRVDSAGYSTGRYLLYNPCVPGDDPKYCLGQFNNQMNMLWNALAIARAMQRTLVVPPFLWMANQSADEQHWFRASHFLDICALSRQQPVVELQDFVAELIQTGRKVSASLYPPYLLTERQQQFFSGRFYKQWGIDFTHGSLPSPFEEVRPSLSGMGVHAYRPDMGQGFWAAAELLYGRHHREWLEHTRTTSAQDSNTLLATMLSRQTNELLEWSGIANEHPELRGAAIWKHPKAVDAIVFDFAPAYNFNVDCFEFDNALKRVQAVSRFHPRLLSLAEEAKHALMGQRHYLAAHLRRDGYEQYCIGSGLHFFKSQRFGVHVTQNMCYPSIPTVAYSLNTMKQLHGLQHVLLATNSLDDEELESLQRKILYKRWHPPRGTPPEWVPIVDLLLCAMADAFVGTLPSTFTASIIAQRDLMGRPRNTTAFFGALTFF